MPSLSGNEFARAFMRAVSKAAILIGLSLMSAAAVADNQVNIRVYNDQADDILLSVYDMNAQPPAVVVADQRINGFAWIPVSVAAGAVGKGHLKWIARTVDPDFRRCGYREVRGVASDALVSVSANSSCRGVQNGVRPHQVQ
jgi:hypothetical protein